MQRSAEDIYFCWGAQHGLYEKNVIEDCTYGMTFGLSDSVPTSDHESRSQRYNHSRGFTHSTRRRRPRRLH